MLLVDVRLLNPTLTSQAREIEEYVNRYLKAKYGISSTDQTVPFMPHNCPVTIDFSGDSYLSSRVEHMQIDEIGTYNRYLFICLFIAHKILTTIQSILTQTKMEWRW